MTPDNHPALPELPRPALHAAYDRDGYTADQMRAYALESLRRGDGATLGEGRELRSLIYKAMAKLVQLGEPEALASRFKKRQRWHTELIERERVVDIVLSTKKAMESISATPTAQRVATTGAITDDFARGWNASQKRLRDQLDTITAQRAHAVDYDRELIAEMLDRGRPYFADEAIDEQIKLLRAANNAEAAAVHTAQRVAAGDDDMEALRAAYVEAYDEEEAWLETSGALFDPYLPVDAGIRAVLAIATNRPVCLDCKWNPGLCETHDTTPPTGEAVAYPPKFCRHGGETTDATDLLERAKKAVPVLRNMLRTAGLHSGEAVAEELIADLAARQAAQAEVSGVDDATLRSAQRLYRNSLIESDTVHCNRSQRGWNELTAQEREAWIEKAALTAPADVGGEPRND